MSINRTIVTVAGTGRLGSSGDGGLATEAELNRPYGLAPAQDGSVYFTEYFGSCVRRLIPDGTLVRVAGKPDSFGFEGDGGPAPDALLENPYGIAIDGDGNVFIADDENARIRRISADGLITTIAGTGEFGDAGDGGPAVAASFNTLGSLALAPDGSLYVADSGNARIRRIDLSGVISTVAGTGKRGATGDGGQAKDAELYQPFSITFGPDGDFYISDGAASRVRHVDARGIIRTVVGSGVRGSDGDGELATRAQLNAPTGICFGSDGTLYIGEFGGFRVRAVSPEGVIRTVAGTGAEGSSGDGGPAHLAKLSRPRDVAVGLDGRLYIADSENCRIRVIDLGVGAG